MALKFADKPCGVHRDPDYVVITARDSESNEHIECRISYDVFVRKYRSQGIADDKLLSAFETNRADILAVAQQKYETGSVERTANGIILVLIVEDFGPV